MSTPVRDEIVGFDFKQETEIAPGIRLKAGRHFGRQKFFGEPPLQRAVYEVKVGNGELRALGCDVPDEAEETEHTSFDITDLVQQRRVTIA